MNRYGLPSSSSTPTPRQAPHPHTVHNSPQLLPTTEHATTGDRSPQRLLPVSMARVRGTGFRQILPRLRLVEWRLRRHAPANQIDFLFPDFRYGLIWDACHMYLSDFSVTGQFNRHRAGRGSLIPRHRVSSDVGSIDRRRHSPAPADNKHHRRLAVPRPPTWHRPARSSACPASPSSDNCTCRHFD